jgi:hypothetical protein
LGRPGRAELSHLWAAPIRHLRAVRESKHHRALSTLWLVLVLAVGLLAIILWAVWIDRGFRKQGFDPFAEPPRLKPQHAFGSGSVTFHGGARVGSTVAVWPVVRLTVDESWARLAFFGEVWIPRAGVTMVRSFRGPIGSGVLFDSASDEFAGVSFRTFSPEKVLDAFKRSGWPAATLG